MVYGEAMREEHILTTKLAPLLPEGLTWEVVERAASLIEAWELNTDAMPSDLVISLYLLFRTPVPVVQVPCTSGVRQ